MSRLLLPIAAIALAAIARSSSAQIVQGSVVDELNRPVSSGVVSLTAADGSRVRAALTDEQGRFRIIAPAGTWGLRLERVGFAPVTLAPMSLAEGETLQRDVTASALPARLAPVVVRGTTACGGRSRDSEAIVRLWDEVRKTLDVAVLGAEERSLELNSLRYERDLALHGRVMRLVSAAERPVFDQRPFVSHSPEGLVAEGFVRGSADTGLEFHAPDANVLVSSAFAEAYCFLLVRSDPRDPTVTGLGFRPNDRNALGGVEGTLWVDRNSGRLRRLDWSYVNLPAHVPAYAARGQLEFARLPSERWVVRRWHIRMPILGAYTVRRDPSARQYSTQHLREVGGTVITVRAADGTETLLGGTGSVIGTVYDSISRKPIARARVTLAERQLTAVADDRGRFTFRDVPAGRYTVEAQHDRLDAVGVTVIRGLTAVLGGEESEVPLHVPPLAVLWQRLCSDEGDPKSNVMVHGTVSDLDTRVAVPGALVSLEYQIRHTRDGIEQVFPASLQTETDDRGEYRLCQVPRGLHGKLIVSRADYSGSSAVIEQRGDSSVRTDVVMRRTSASP